MPLASLDGAIADVADVRIPVTDDGFLRGDGVFEVLRLYAGRPFALEDHLRRMAQSARNLRLPFDSDAMRADVEALLARAGAGDMALRLVATRGGRRLAMLEDLKHHAPSVALATVTYAPTRALDGVKSLSYAANMLTTRLAEEQGADEALLVTPHGRVLEAPTSSFFYVLEGERELYTPPLDDHILDSITRRRVRDVHRLTERVTTLDDLARADEAFLASSIREVQPVHRIDDRELPAPGRVTREVEQLVRERIERELAEVPA
jgi:branched-chain amino acid aminotransferase